ncbi:MAG: NAD(P)-dependent oxidoreductase [Hyphomicrobiales bacterium]|nr:NAD(P)-dependent oxidoreductase [Hyphomicrobiales bacterium]
MNEYSIPVSFEDAEALDEFMTRPSPALVADLEALDGDIMIIGVGGKMGPTLARLAKRALPDRRVIAVARFSDRGLKAYLESHGVETLGADLLDQRTVSALPPMKNLIFMAGRKFGSQGSEELTWAMNGYVPALVADRFGGSRIIVYSTICVYPFVPVLNGGAREEESVAPPGEYAMSCVARERMFEYFAKLHGSPTAIMRLSYAIDMRYGVLHDVASKVFAGEPIDVTMGHVNVIWQGDACSQSLRMLRHAAVPALPLNVSGPETVSIRELARTFAKRFGKAAIITGEEADSAWLADTGKAAGLFGYPSVPLRRMIGWTADWIERGKGSFGKATHFEVRTGTY